jgi:hypothetical protein
MPAEPRPIDWEAPYGLDWVVATASLVYSPTIQRAQFEVVRMSISDRELKRKTGIWAQLPDTRPRDAYESLFGVYRILRDCESDYWVRYKGKQR